MRFESSNIALSKLSIPLLYNHDVLSDDIVSRFFVSRIFCNARCPAGRNGGGTPPRHLRAWPRGVMSLVTIKGPSRSAPLHYSSAGFRGALRGIDRSLVNRSYPTHRPRDSLFIKTSTSTAEWMNGWMDFQKPRERPRSFLGLGLLGTKPEL